MQPALMVPSAQAERAVALVLGEAAHRYVQLIPLVERALDAQDLIALAALRQGAADGAIAVALTGRLIDRLSELPDAEIVGADLRAGRGLLSLLGDAFTLIANADPALLPVMPVMSSEELAEQMSKPRVQRLLRSV